MFDFININWDKLNSPTELGAFILIIITIGTAVWYILSKRKADAVEKLDQRTILSYKERLEVVEKETQDCHNQHAESLKMIHTLQGELNTYKELVLIPKNFIKELQRNQTEIIKLIKEKK